MRWITTPLPLGTVGSPTPIDFAAITSVDSSAVALLLEWRRQAMQKQKTLVFVNLPANLLALADLYGVAELIQTQA